MPSYRTITLCAVLVLVSCMVTISLRNVEYTTSWPAMFGGSVQQMPNLPNDHPFQRAAFATFIGGDTEQPDTNSTEERDDNLDGYYVGARVLAYQLLHNPVTRTNSSIPFIALVTPDVSKRKRARLAKDGATVVLADKIDSDWAKPATHRWRDVFGKLRLFQLTAYKKICFIDADTLVTKRLDGVFADPATDLIQTKAIPEKIAKDEGPMPSHFMFAGKPEAYGYGHELPPPEGEYLNSGFFVFAPSKALFEYYMSILSLKGRFDPAFPDQNLLNYAHRLEGNMPWQRLSWRWNMNWPTVKDMEGGARSFHAKYWSDDPTHDPDLKKLWQLQRAEMEGYYRGIDEANGLRH